MTIKTIILLAVTSLTVFGGEIIHLPRDKNQPPYYKLINRDGHRIRTTRSLGEYLIRYKSLVMLDNHYAETNIDFVKNRISKNILKKTAIPSS